MCLELFILFCVLVYGHRPPGGGLPDNWSIPKVSATFRLEVDVDTNRLGTVG